jgi:hypothetical protein
MASNTETLVKLEIRVADTAFQPIRRLRLELAQSDTKVRWYRDLLLCLVNSTIREYLNLKIGYQRSTAFQSWACRNLLELSILAKYISQSEKNAKQFMGDRIIDGIEWFESFEAWYAHEDPQRQVPELDQILARLRTRKARAGVTATKVLRVGELAKSVGMDAEFKHMNKVCSKFIHPTAFSVLNALDAGELKSIGSLLLHRGSHYGFEIYTTFRTHILRYGVKPA